MTGLTIVTAVVSSGLVAGLFWGWVVAAAPGLARVPDRTYVSSMQAINTAILNPFFLIVFMGAGLALAAAAVVNLRVGEIRRAWWFGAAAITYVVGVLGITMGGNVPLNNQLDRFPLEGASDADTASARVAYEGPWNRLHDVRTVASVVAVALASAGALSAETA